MSNREEFWPNLEDWDESRGKEHSIVQNTLGELRSISRPALRLVIAEHLKVALDEIIEDSVTDVINQTRAEAKKVH